MTVVKVDPGVCGFICSVLTTKKALDKVDVRIESKCDMVTALGQALQEVTIQDLFKRPFQ